MKVLFISYWSIDEPLTDSTILPYMRLLMASPAVKEVVLVTVERSGRKVAPRQVMEGVEHLPFRERFPWTGPFAKVDLFIRMLYHLSRFARRRKIDMVDSKAALGGGIAHLVSRFSGVPYLVESFEPHSEYMADCGMWSRKGLYYNVARRLEAMQIRHARYLVTVTWNYRDHLVGRGVASDRVKVIPSVTDLERFAFDPVQRAAVRQELGWSMDVPVGIYVGKFGGLYYDAEAFEVFGRMRKAMGGRLNMIVLTNEREEVVRAALENVGFPADEVVVRFSPHSEVPRWLSASDMAFATIKYAPHGLYQSPVKNGEYWANGLPILLTYGVSDDFRIITREPWSGALFDLAEPGSLDRAVAHMAELVRAGAERERIMALAREHRSVDLARRIYAEIFDGAGTGSDQARKARTGDPLRK